MSLFSTPFAFAVLKTPSGITHTPASSSRSFFSPALTDPAARSVRCQIHPHFLPQASARTRIPALTLFLALSLTLSPAGLSAALPPSLYTKIDSETITAGAVYERQVRFTTEGWLNINVLRIDLAHPNIRVDTLTDAGSLQKLKSTAAHARDAKAVAAINGSYFSWLPNNMADPVGPHMTDSRLLNFPSGYNRSQNSLATLAIDHLGQAVIDYWQLKTMEIVRADGGGALPIARYNSPYTGTNDYTVIDHRLASTSLGNTKYADLTEVLVIDDVVWEVRRSMPATPIPENGYIILACGDYGAALAEKFPVGTRLRFNIATTPDWHSFQTAVSGGSILLKDGQTPASYSYDNGGLLNNRQPSTIVGLSRDGQFLIMAVIDGRQPSSIGLTLAELSSLSAEIGAWNALALDGGGSSTLVYRKPGTETIVTANSPSGASMRAVPNALGVFSTSEPGPVNSLRVDAPDTKVFANTSISFTAYGLDRNLNPAAIDAGQIQWRADGVSGVWNGSTFTPSEPGMAVITAAFSRTGSQPGSQTDGQIGSQTDGQPDLNEAAPTDGEYIVAVRELKVLDNPVELIITTGALQMTTGTTKELTISAKNAEGYTAKLPANDPAITWSVNSDIASISGSTLTAQKHGAALLTASLGPLSSSIGLSVRNPQASLRQIAGFDDGALPLFSSTHYTAYGEAYSEPVVKTNGSAALRLSYMFYQDSGAREVRFDWPAGSVVIPDGYTKLSLAAYNDTALASSSSALGGPNMLLDTTSQIKALLTDANGSTHTVTLASRLDWEGWKTLECPLPKIPYPAQVSRLFLVHNDSATVQGSLCLDALSVGKEVPYPALPSIPAKVKLPDAANTAVNNGSGTTSIIAVFAQGRELNTQNKTDQQIISGLKKINPAVDGWALVGSSPHAVASQLKTPRIATYSGCNKAVLNNILLLQLDVSKGGMRATNTDQWNWVRKQLEAFTGDNVLVFLAAAPSYFRDSLEAQLLRDTLADYHSRTGKTVAVVFQDAADNDMCTLNNGVRYLSLKGLPASGSPGALTYLEIVIKGSALTYQFLPLP